jgi:transglutaminase-like putative cysteine protease
MISRIDYFENLTTQFAFNQGYETLSVIATSQVEVQPLPVPTEQIAWETVRGDIRNWRTDEEFSALEFSYDSPRCRISPELEAYARPSFPAGGELRGCLADLNRRVYSDFHYDSTATNATTPVEHVFRIRKGVCQDFAHLMISLVRSIGLPARYISGYLRTIPPRGQARLVGADASHAWVSVFCGNLGWVDLDPTNNQFPSTDHVTIAWGRDYSDVAPLKGVYIGGSSPQLTVSVDVVDVTDEKVSR